MSCLSFINPDAVAAWHERNEAKCQGQKKPDGLAVVHRRRTTASRPTPMGKCNSVWQAGRTNACRRVQFNQAGGMRSSIRRALAALVLLRKAEIFRRRRIA